MMLLDDRKPQSPNLRKSGKFFGALLIILSTVTSGYAQANVKLAWNSSTDPLVAGFNIYYGTTSGVYTNEINVGTNTSLTISNLVIGNTYYFAATTYSAVGAESALSTSVSYTVPIPPPNVKILVWPTNQFALTVTGLSGHAYNIVASQNLAAWTIIGTVTTGTNGLATFTDTNAANYSSRFYRVY